MALKGQRNFVERCSKKIIDSITAISEPKNQHSKTGVNVLNKQIKNPAWLFSPMPPDKSGIADYSKSLSEGLSDYYEVTIVNSSYKLSSNKNLKQMSCKILYLTQ